MTPLKPDQLQPHPEGGRFQEVFRSVSKVQTEKGERSALTHIYFELSEGEKSRLHRVSSEEVWNLYEGKLRLHLYDGTTFSYVELSSESRVYCHVVPAGVWQAAEAIEGSALVGCSVGPGFEFEDFDMLKDTSEQEAFLKSFPGERDWV